MKDGLLIIIIQIKRSGVPGSTFPLRVSDGWVADYNNPNQKKWIPWFVFSPSGVRFIVSLCNNSDANAGRAARLCFKDEATSDAAGVKLIDLYEISING